MITQAQQDTLQELQAYLKRIASKFAYLYGVDSSDDILAQMNLAILERGSHDASFLDHPAGYITKYAAWRARDYLGYESKGNHHGWNREAFSLDALDPGDDLIAERIGAADPDVDLALDVQQALSSLSEKTRTVARVLMQGVSGIELYRRSGLSNAQAVNYHRRLIRQALREVT